MCRGEKKKFFLRKCSHSASTAAASLYIPSVVHRIPSVFTFSQHLLSFCFCCFVSIAASPNGHELSHCCSLDLCFFTDSWSSASFYIPSLFVDLLEKCLFKLFAF